MITKPFHVVLRRTQAVSKDVVTDKVVNAEMSGLSAGETLDRSRRVSLTMRHLLPRCACQG
eukprot:6037259-Amphidinium_carterae.1